MINEQSLSRIKLFESSKDKTIAYLTLENTTHYKASIGTASLSLSKKYWKMRDTTIEEKELFLEYVYC